MEADDAVHAMGEAFVVRGDQRGRALAADQSEELGENQTGALLVWGDADQVVPRGCIDVYERSIPNTRVAVVNGVGHRPEIEDPATFIQLVSGFLAD